MRGKDRNVTVTLRLPQGNPYTVLARFYTEEEAREYVANAPSLNPEWRAQGYYVIGSDAV